MVFAGFAESVAVTPTVKIPGVCGVPVMVQSEFRVRPFGMAPETTEQLYGAVPPATRIAPTYGTLTIATGGAVMVSVTSGACTVTVTVAVVVLTGFAESVAVTPMEVVPATNGTPLMTQSEPSVRPAGMAPEASTQWYGAVPPVTETAPLYGMPTVAAGGDEMTSTAGAGLITMVMGPVPVTAGLPASVALTVKVPVPAVVGVPVTAQLLPRVRPAGREPEATEQVYGAVPPTMVMLAAYGTWTVPLGRVEVEMVSDPPDEAALIFSVRGRVAVALVESVTCAVKVEVPAAVGVPEMTPAVEMLRPAGSVPLLMLQV